MKQDVKTLILSDNLFIVNSIQELMKNLHLELDFKCSTVSPLLNHGFTPISVKSNIHQLIKGYDLIISAHCNQLFPAELVKSVRCINIHPGLNPFNRGWYPQVFSILNKMPLGATIHEMDEELDHGAIICQKEVPVYVWDTSLSAYERVQEAEIDLIKKWMPQLISGNYKTYKPENEGNLNLKKDFIALCKIDLEQQQSIGETIELLRALSHGDFKNAFFIDEMTGEKIYLRLDVSKN